LLLPNTAYNGRVGIAQRHSPQGKSAIQLGKIPFGAVTQIVSPQKLAIKWRIHRDEIHLNS
jgi:hypothetical protein